MKVLQITISWINSALDSMLHHNDTNYLEEKFAFRQVCCFFKCMKSLDL